MKSSWVGKFSNVNCYDIVQVFQRNLVIAENDFSHDHNWIGNSKRSAVAEFTSREARQNQQKTWRQLLHIIWAQPSSRSIGIYRQKDGGKERKWRLTRRPIANQILRTEAKMKNPPGRTGSVWRSLVVPKTALDPPNTISHILQKKIIQPFTYNLRREKECSSYDWVKFRLY